MYQLVAIKVFRTTVGGKGYHGGGWVNSQDYCHGIIVSPWVKIAYVDLRASLSSNISNTWELKKCRIVVAGHLGSYIIRSMFGCSQ